MKLEGGVGVERMYKISEKEENLKIRVKHANCEENRTETRYYEIIQRRNRIKNDKYMKT